MKNHKIIDLINQFEAEIKIHITKISKRKYNKIIKVITKIKYEKISFEYTGDDTYFFNIVIDDETKVHAEIFKNNICFYNIYKNKESKYIGLCKLRQLKKRIKYYLSLYNRRLYEQKLR